jgi:hypothetical protein
MQGVGKTKSQVNLSGHRLMIKARMTGMRLELPFERPPFQRPGPIPEGHLAARAAKGKA